MNITTNDNILFLPSEIMAYIASFLDGDMFVIKFYSAFPEYRNDCFLPKLKNNYNFFYKDYQIAEKFLKYGFRMNIVSNFSSLGLLLNKPYIHNVISLKLYIKKKTIILRNNIYKLKNIRELIIPDCCIDFNIKKLPKSLRIYKYYDSNDIINPQKYSKYGITCINLYYNNMLV
jgi:hypothetical protein